MFLKPYRLTLAILCLGTNAHARPQTYPTVATGGLIPESELGTYRAPAATGLPSNPASSSSNSSSNRYSNAALAALWETVEAGIPVQNASITNVVEVSNFTVPKTPSLPRSLKPSVDKKYKFPKGFKYGVASAAQQIEGAAKADGRGPSHWDYNCHVFPTMCNNFTSDVTDNQYYLYKQDIARIKAMGVNAYSFSISWTRIFPFGKADSPVNEAGLQHYDDLINELIKNDIEPIATLFHWDTPLNLVFEYGAFLNGSVVNDFAKYAETVFKRYGDRVKTWVTFNEPRVYCSNYGSIPFNLTYTVGTNSSTAPYLCTYNILKSHGQAVKVYRDLVNNGTICKGEIALKNDDSKPVPWRAGNAADEEASARHEAFQIGIFSQPIYGDGNYPQIVRDTLGSIIPPLTAEDQKLIKGSADFYAIDSYRTNVAKSLPGGAAACAKNISDPNWPNCQDGSNSGQFATSSGYALGSPADPLSSWLYNTAQYLRYQLKFLHSTYPSPKIYLSEFGFAEPFEYERQDLYQITWDTSRTAYYMDYLSESLLAIHDDGIPLAGTFAWSIVDNFEWGLGLQERFGLQYVNYSDPELPRTYKLSFLAMRDFFDEYLEK